MRDSRPLPTSRALGARAILAAALAAAFLAAASPVAATILAINTTTDQSLGDCSTTCSLRDAIALSHPGDALPVPAGTYVLTLGPIQISNSLIVAGSGARTTVIDGNAGGSIFQISAAAGSGIVIRDLSLVNAAGAGAISAQGPSPATPQSLALVSTTIANNQSTGNGGGVVADSTNLSISACTFSGNQAAGSGGGLFATNAAVTISNSTFSGNAAGSSGGGIGMIDTRSQLQNSTVAANLSGAGLEALGGNLTVFNSIVANNGGGDCVLGASSDQGFNISSFHNLDSDHSCFFFDSTSQTTDPRLGPLANHGGTTDTQALLGGSPAIDTGFDPLCPPSDQRGVSRPQGAHCDIGAYEDTKVSISVDRAAVFFNEGQTATNTGKVHDADGDAITLTASFGTVVNNGDGTWSWSGVVNEPPLQSVTITAQTDDGPLLANSVTFFVVVQDVPPAIFSVTNSGPIVAPGSATITVNAADTTGGNDTLSYSFDCDNDGIFEIGPQASNTATCSFATPGSYTVNVQVTDGEGGVTPGSTVVVATPDCTHAAASPNQLWPPNGKFVPIQITGVTGAGTIVVTSIFQDEPVVHGPDATGVGTATPAVRAERDGDGDGRVYHISFTGTSGGASCTGSVTVGVPHDQGQHSTPIDEGSLFDSTLP